VTMAFIEDPRKETIRRIQEIRRSQTTLHKSDDKELREREEAAQRYAGEAPRHFVDYGNDCVSTSVKAMTKIRQTQKECWDCYNEEAPPNYSSKEDWQSKVIVPKPFVAVQFAMAVVRKAFSSDFLSIQNEQDRGVASFWEKLMQHEFNQNNADFAISFTDSTGMAFAVGQSLEMIPVWRPGKGLRFILVEPWKIHRDPDAISRNPQSGLYWIHQEYMDYYRLKASEKRGIYRNIDDVKGYLEGSTEGLSDSEIAARKNMYWTRSKFRKAVLTSEFWGSVLSPKGEVLLESAKYTWAGNQVIEIPKRSPYRTLRWPGVSFSPLPNFIRFDGRGLLEGVKTLWYWMCSLLSLHSDNLNWLVNPPREIDVSALVDQDDLDDYPGKTTPTRGTVSGQQAIRTIDRKSITNEVLANLNYGDQTFQRGAMVTDLVQGLPGWRAEVTAREQAQNLERAMSVFSLMGMNLENGAIKVTEAAAEVVEASIDLDTLVQVFGEGEIETLIDEYSPTGVSLPELNGSFHISGISAIMKDAEILKAIRDMILPLCVPNSPFMQYIQPYKILRSIERRTNLEDEGILVPEPEGEETQEEQRGRIGEEERMRTEMARAETDLRSAEVAKTESEAAMPRGEVH
jgi:hypothetical protein